MSEQTLEIDKSIIENNSNLFLDVQNTDKIKEQNITTNIIEKNEEKNEEQNETTTIPSESSDKRNKTRTRIKMLGEGTYGRVSRAEYKGKKCAVKINLFHEWTNWGDGIINVVEYDMLKRFSSHPLFLELYDVFNRDDDFFKEVNSKTLKTDEKIFDRSDQKYDNMHFIMELGDCSLSDLIDDIELDMDSVAKILCDILLGLEFLHMNNVIHRDLKTSNIIIFKDEVENDYIAKICDFGMSKYFTNQDENCSDITTYTSRSPELVMKEKYGFPSDVWTVGCILYEMLFDLTVIDLPIGKNSKKESVYKFDRRTALISIFRYANHNISIENINRILRSLDLKKTSANALKREPIETMVNKLSDNGFYDDYSKQNLIQLLNGLLEFDQTKRLTCTQALNLPFFNSMAEYIKDVRKYNVKLDMLGRDLKIVNSTFRTAIYDKIKAKTIIPGIYSTQERIDIHSLIMFERVLRALSKLPENDKDIKDNYDKYYTICSGLVEKMFNEGGKAPKTYVNKIKNMDLKWFTETEEIIVLDVLDYVYEITPYELAVEQGLKVKGPLYNAIIDVMFESSAAPVTGVGAIAPISENIMNMKEILDKAIIRAEKAQNQKRTTAAPVINKYKNKIPRNRK